MLQVEITALKPEYKKYLFDDRFICREVIISKDMIKFRSLWGEEGWYREIPMGNGYYDIKITQVK
jgi:hypothetical protein